MSDRNVFDDAAVERIARAVRQEEARAPKVSMDSAPEDAPDWMPAGTDWMAPSQVVRVTSGTLTNIPGSNPVVQAYPGKVQSVPASPTAPGNTDFLPRPADLGTCWVVGLNGEVLKPGIVRAIRSGNAADGNPFFVLESTASTDPVFGASGPGHAAGDVPDPGNVAGTTRMLFEDGLWKNLAYRFSGARLGASGIHLPAGGSTSILFGGPPAFDTDNYWDSHFPYRLNAPFTGYYLCGGSASTSGVGLGSANVGTGPGGFGTGPHMTLSLTPGPTVFAHGNGNNSFAGLGTEVSFLGHLNAGDTVLLTVGSDSTFPWDITAFLWMFFLPGVPA